VIRGLRRLAVLAGLGVALAWVLDRVLRARIGGDQPPPFRSLMVIDAPIERVWAVLADVEANRAGCGDEGRAPARPVAGGRRDPR
jgi:hypothetical protein